MALELYLRRGDELVEAIEGPELVRVPLDPPVRIPEDGYYCFHWSPADGAARLERVELIEEDGSPWLVFERPAT